MKGKITFTNDTDLFVPDGIGPNPGVTVISSITATGVVPSELGSGVIKSVCLDIGHVWNEDLNIFLRAPNGNYIELSTGNGQSSNDSNVCFVDDVNFPLIAEPGTPRPANNPAEPSVSTHHWMGYDSGTKKVVAQFLVF